MDGRESELPLCEEISISSRINQLPDDVLLHILSFLDSLPEKLRTSVLSKRWRYLCRKITCLDFDASTVLLTRYERLFNCRWYISWINSVIEPRLGAADELSFVKHLMIRYPLDKKHRHHIRKWIKFAIANRVETLHLNLGDHKYTEKQYGLSKMLWYCVPSGLSSIKCLRSLSLEYVNVNKQFVDFILSSCPLLEDLTLVFAANFTNLDISGVPPLRLKRLNIHSETNHLLTVLAAPSLTSFYYVSNRFSPQMLNVPMLTDLFIGGNSPHPEFMDIYLEPFWNYLPQLEKLQLLMKPRHAFKFTRIPPQLVKLRYLRMDIWKTDLFLNEIIKFISFCPLLETLAFKAYPKLPIPDRPLLEPEQREKTQESYRKLENNCVFESLKVLELYGADGKMIDLKLVDCIISKSPNLQKLKVNGSYSDDKCHDLPSRPLIIEVAKAKAELVCQGRCPEIAITVIDGSPQAT